MSETGTPQPIVPDTSTFAPKTSDAIKTLMPEMCPVCVVVDHVKRSVRIFGQKPELTADCRARVNAVTGSYTVMVEKPPVSSALD